MKGERARVSRAALALAADPDLAIERAVFDLLFDLDDAELTPAQRAAKLTAIYCGAVDNGGHLQYFHNEGVADGEALMAALDRIGAPEQLAIFRQALAHVRAHPVDQAASLDDYAARAGEREYERLDDAFYACADDLSRVVLPRYIKANVAEFVEFVEFVD